MACILHDSCIILYINPVYSFNLCVGCVVGRGGGGVALIQQIACVDARVSACVRWPSRLFIYTKPDVFAPYSHSSLIPRRRRSANSFSVVH